MDQVGTDTSLVLTIKLIKDFSPAVTLQPVLTPYVGIRNALRIINIIGRKSICCRSPSGPQIVYLLIKTNTLNDLEYLSTHYHFSLI